MSSSNFELSQSSIFSFGKFNSFIFSEHAFPNTTISNNEFAPNLLAPCTELEAASPAAHKPFIILF